MNNYTNLFTYQFINNKASKTLVLLHGTGGTEQDFLFLNDQLKSSYNLLGLRGNIDEGGLQRFFKRKSVGVFDQENIKLESHNLNLFMLDWMKIHKMNVDQFVFLGYSNGANMILATMFYYPELIKNVVLLRPILPFTPTEKLDLSKNTVLIHYSTNDELVDVEDSIALIELLRSFRADVTFQSYSTGHQLSSSELEHVTTFLL